MSRAIARTSARAAPAGIARGAHRSRSFVYVASKPGGGRSLGLRQATSQRALAERLRKDRQVLLRSLPLPGWVGGEQSLSAKDQMALNEQLAQLLGRGVPLVEALEVAETVVSPQRREIVGRIREMVAAGSSFADAARQAGGFDTTTIAIYRAAERTGDLAGAGRELAAAVKRRLRIQGKAATLLTYPLIVLAIGVLASVGMIVFIVPGIAETLREATGSDLPVYTRVLVGTGNFIRGQILLVLGVLAGLAVVAIAARRTVARTGSRLSRTLPVLRDVVLTQERARLFSVLAAMTRSGVPLADALGVGTAAIGHPKLRRQLDRLRTRLVGGGVLVRLIDEVDALPLPTRKLLIAADRSGDLEQAFEGLAADTADDLEKQTERLLAVIEPILIVLLFTVIGALVMAIMIPLLTTVANQI